MKTIYLVMRHDYKTEPIIAFDNEEDARAFMSVLDNVCERTFEIFHVPYSNDREGFINPVALRMLQTDVDILKEKILEITKGK